MVKKEVVQTNTKQELITRGRENDVTLTKKEVIELLQQVDGIKRKLKAKLQTV